MNQQEIINAMALTRLSPYESESINTLYRKVGTATDVLALGKNVRDVLPSASNRLVDAMGDVSEVLRRAEQEFAATEKHGIKVLLLDSDDYPQRLSQCNDAPLVVYFKGTANLNARRVVSIVGTRHATPYGIDLVGRFMTQLRTLCPEVLVMSGLAYGIDICAHREALRQGYETVAVLAHGLDDLYPYAHRQTAVEMVGHGGLLTEYMFGTRAERLNFLRRNRIVAGMADATILVESASQGGGLVTVRIANEYGRKVMAFPGAIGAQFSEGCNQLIRQGQATLITSATDFVETMDWTTDQQCQKAQEQGIERQLFPDLTADEQRVVEALRQQNDTQTGELSRLCNMPIGQLTAVLFALEMKGQVRALAGGAYHLIA